jgi:hypothetical protein
MAAHDHFIAQGQEHQQCAVHQLTQRVLHPAQHESYSAQHMLYQYTVSHLPMKVIFFGFIRLLMTITSSRMPCIVAWLHTGLCPGASLPPGGRSTVNSACGNTQDSMLVKQRSRHNSQARAAVLREIATWRQVNREQRLHEHNTKEAAIKTG